MPLFASLSRSRHTAGGVALGLALGAAPLAPVQAQTISVVHLGPGAITDLSADGRAAAGQFNDSYVTFRWTPETGFVSLGRGTYRPLGGQTSGVPRISADGQTVAATIIDTTKTYYTQGLWTQATGWQQLNQPLPPDGGLLDSGDSSVFGLSRDGRVVTGLYWRPDQPGGSAHGSLWREDTGMTGLTTRGGSSRVDDANQDGSVVVGWEEDPLNGSRQPAVWVNGERSVLGVMGEAASVNGAGTQIVGQSYDEATATSMATLWTRVGSTWKTRLLGVLPGTKPGGYSYATAASDDGQLVVGFNRRNFLVFKTQAFIWTPHTGMVEASAFLKSRGVDLGDRVKIDFLPAVTPRGHVIAALSSDLDPPYTRRSLLIKLKP
jgi:uncharacterized membrane protein